MKNSILLTQYKLNEKLTLDNRIIMAPMTRSFADNNLIPTKDIANYYSRRASAGLIISEGTIIKEDGQGYPNTPGIFTEEQIEGWKRVTDTVHSKDGKIFCQLWHVGRVSHPKYLNGNLPVAPSAVKLNGRVPRGGDLQYGTPRALDTTEIPNYVDSFIQGAINAIKSGFDGVEIHGAHGYLIDEFLHYDTNRRDDEYGGNPKNMSKFILDIVNGIIKEIGNEKIGLRLSPSAYFNIEINEMDSQVFDYLFNELNKLDLAYMHQGIIDESRKPNYISESPVEFFRSKFNGNLMGNGSYNVNSAAEAISNKIIDLVSFGQPFIANPDLITKIKNGEALLPYNSDMLKKLY